MLSGFLGAGKTTLLNRILRGTAGRRYAVIVNEFGELGIDGALVVGAEEEVHELNNGCVCCKVRGDLIRVIGSLVRRPGRFDGIIIECSGLADPAPVLQTLHFDDFLRQHTRPDSVICVADCRHLPEQLRSIPEAAAQLAQADLVLINKMDLADQDELAAAEAAVASANPMAEVVRCAHGDVALEQLLEREAFDITNLRFPTAPLARQAGDGRPAYTRVDRGQHSTDLRCASFTFEREFEGRPFFEWLQRLVIEQGKDLLRGKGIVALRGNDKRFVFQTVHMTVDSGADRAWGPDEPRHSRVVLIGRNLDEHALQMQLEQCLAQGVAV